jgi:hypothetical protein
MLGGKEGKMNTSTFQYDDLDRFDDKAGSGSDFRCADIRETEVRISLEPLSFLRWLPLAGALSTLLQVIAGALMLLLFAEQLALAGIGSTTLLPMMLVALVGVTFVLALDVNRSWWLLLTAMQLALLAPAGYWLAGQTMSVSHLVFWHALLTLALMLDYRALRQWPVRVWMGAEIGLLVLTIMM